MKIKTATMILAGMSTLFISCGTGKSESGNEADSVNAHGSSSNSSVNKNGDGQALTYTLKWKEVWFMEYGPTFLFEDREGKEFSFNHLEPPEFNFDDNIYFTTTRFEDRVIPELKLKEDIKDKWFRITVEKQIKEIEGLGEEGEVDVIVGIDPVE